MRSVARVAAGVLFLMAGAGAAVAEDVAGVWNLSYTTRDGVKMASTLTVKSEGGTLSGTISSPRGTIALDEITIKGDDIAFAVIRVGFGDRIRIDYTGKVNGTTMKLRMRAGARDPIDVTARRGG